MRKIILVLQQELTNTFKRPSYLFFAVGIPILVVLIAIGINIFKEDSGETSSSNDEESTEWKMEREGFVDQSGLIEVVPSDLPEGNLISFETETSAQEALQNEEITAYYVIPEDYIERGEIYYVYPDSRSYLDDGQKWVMGWTLMVNLLDGEIEAASRVWNPIWTFEEKNLSLEGQVGASSAEACLRPGSDCASNDFIRYMPSLMTAFLFVVFMVSSSMLFNSIGAEKENRTIEVILLSLKPKQLLAGKLTAAGIAGIIQTTLWLIAIFILFNQGGSTLRFPEGFTFPLDIVIWSILFFVGGYAFYGSLMAGAGALVPRMKEAGIANFIAMMPLMLGYLVGLLAPLSGNAKELLPVVLSIFPFTSPVVMIMRLTDGYVPLWHLILSIGLLYLSAYFALRIVSAMFRAQNLLSGQPFSLTRYFQVLAGREPKSRLFQNV
jgi:ABC-2 type transport system permease protein